MGLLKSAADIVYTIRFLKLLVTPIEDTEAFKKGIVDENGKKRKDFDDGKMENREALRDHYTAFHRLVFNIKKLMAKAPGGKSVIARYGAALYLIKEQNNLSDADIEKIHNATGIDILDVLAEEHKWYILKNDEIGPGTYKLIGETLTQKLYETQKGDQVRITNGKPIDEILGIKIYEGVHIKTSHRIYMTTGEITK